MFSVGKRTGQRCFAHVAEARPTAADAVGDDEKLGRIRAIEASGEAVGIQVLRHGLTEDVALLVESASIDLLHLEHLTNRVAGFGSGAVGRISAARVNAFYGPKAVELHPAHEIVLVRINRSYRRGMPDAEMYEATRKWWPIARSHGAVPPAPPSGRRWDDVAALPLCSPGRPADGPV